jgi:putative oxidoreductase
MTVVPLVGRVLFALIFLMAAPRHFTSEGIGHAAELGVPLSSLLVPLSGVLAILGALSVATGYYPKVGAWALVLFLVPVTLGMHAFWRVGDPALQHVQQAMTLSDQVSQIGDQRIVGIHLVVVLAPALAGEQESRTSHRLEWPL